MYRRRAVAGVWRGMLCSDAAAGRICIIALILTTPLPVLIALYAFRNSRNIRESADLEGFRLAHELG